jgi:hypothetical protein
MAQLVPGPQRVVVLDMLAPADRMELGETAFGSTE